MHTYCRRVQELSQHCACRRVVPAKLWAHAPRMALGRCLAHDLGLAPHGRPAGRLARVPRLARSCSGICGPSWSFKTIRMRKSAIVSSAFPSTGTASVADNVSAPPSAVPTYALSASFFIAAGSFLCRCPSSSRSITMPWMRYSGRSSHTLRAFNDSASTEYPGTTSATFSADSALFLL